MSLKKVVAKNLRSLRIKNGLSQIEAAEKLGLTGSYLGYLERGERTPGVEVIEKIARFYNVEPYMLLMDSEADDCRYLESRLDKIASFGLSHLRFVYTILDQYLNLLEDDFKKVKN